MEETSEGNATILYENTQSQTHEVDQFSVTLEQYTVVELIDFHTNFAIPFDDETDGGVLIAEYTMTNESDEDLFYMPSLNLSYTAGNTFSIRCCLLAAAYRSASVRSSISVCVTSKMTSLIFSAILIKQTQTDSESSLSLFHL